MSDVAIRPGLTLINGRDRDDRQVRLRIEGRRIVAVEPHAGDRVLDLRGDRVLPGLINAHDHLQLNNFPPLEQRRDYVNVSQWIDEVIARKHIDRGIQDAAAVPLDDRLFLGGLKNLLAGATSVAHHDPLYPSLRDEDFPVHVVQAYGWSHSLAIDGDERVRHAHEQTPADRPWIIHAAEGVDDAAAAEFPRLQALGCITPNTLLVHGVAMTMRQREQLVAAGGGLIWCPASNLRLFGCTPNMADALTLGAVALGTDSRLSGSRDLLDELHIAHREASLSEAALEELATSHAARLLRLRDRGSLAPGCMADVLVLPAGASLSTATRADVRLVVCNGEALYGDVDCVSALAPHAWSPIEVDGRSKALHRRIVARYLEARLHEPGLSVRASESRVA